MDERCKIKEMKNQEIKIILDLIDKVLTTEMTLNKFYTIWPETLEGDVFAEELFDVIESAIEHQPGYFFTNSINIDEWQNSNNYKILLNYKRKLESILE